MTKPVIGYAGMTHLGICSAVAAASKGFTTVGFDPDAALVRRLHAGELPVVEPGLYDLLAACDERIAFSSDPARLSACDVVYVAPDIPTDDLGRSDLASVDALLATVRAATRPEAVVVILSQVPPGFTRALQQSDRPLYYQVETLVFGRAVERATEPERFIVGTPDGAGTLPEPLADFLGAFGCPILPMRLESAELAKISINCCLVASVTVANTLAELCEHVGADWSEIVPALKLDRRIGAYAYLAPGLGIAGGNLERDLATVLRFSEEHGTEAGLIRAFVGNSAHRKNWVLNTLHRHLLATSPDAEIAILGLAYKENTHSTKNSPSLALIRHLGPWKLRVHDPVVAASVVAHPNVIGAATPLEAARGADAVVIMTPWPQYRELAPADLAGAMRGRLVLDPFRTLDPTAARAAGLSYFTLGVN
jgi:UDPglucose 6-dehydrogenase